MNNIKLIRLTTGEEVIANVVEEKSTSFNFLDKTEKVLSLKLEKPVLIIVTQTKTIALAPWCPYGDMDGVDIPIEHVMFYVDLDKDLEHHYIETVTGITTSVPVKS